MPQNVPAAGSLVAASTIYEGAPKDGTVFALIGRDAPLGPITGQPGARFEPTKMSWLGTPTRETNVCVAYHTAKVKTVKDLHEHELIMGDVGPGSGTRVYPKALAGLLGHEVQAGRRLQVVSRRDAGDAARRGAGHLREL